MIAVFYVYALLEAYFKECSWVLIVSMFDEFVMIDKYNVRVTFLTSCVSGSLSWSNAISIRLLLLFEICILESYSPSNRLKGCLMCDVYIEPLGGVAVEADLD